MLPAQKLLPIGKLLSIGRILSSSSDAPMLQSARLQFITGIGASILLLLMPFQSFIPVELSSLETIAVVTYAWSCLVTGEEQSSRVVDWVSRNSSLWYCLLPGQTVCRRVVLQKLEKDRKTL